MKNLKQKEGITLIALVITIIVLLILAGVTIGALTGEQGILTNAKSASERYAIAQGKERIELILAEINMKDIVYKNKTEIDNLVEKIAEKEGITTTEEEEDESTIKVITEEGYMYYVILKEDGKVTVEDIGKATGPLITKIEVTSKSTKSISVETKTLNANGKELIYLYKKQSDSEWLIANESKELTYTYEGLEENQIYSIKIQIKGTQIVKQISVITGELPKGTITFGDKLIWENGTTKTTVYTTSSEYILQYQVNELANEGWTEIENGGTVSDLKHNDILYARLWDGINGSEETHAEIKDVQAPTVTVETSNITTNSARLTVTASDGESGLAENETYQYYLNGSLITTLTTNSYDFTGLLRGTEYTLGVIVIDKAGNPSEINSLNIITEKAEYLYNYGDKCTLLTGGWSNSAYATYSDQGTYTSSTGGTELTASVSGAINWHYAEVHTITGIDLTSCSKIVLVWKYNRGNPNTSKGYAYNKVSIISKSDNTKRLSWSTASVSTNYITTTINFSEMQLSSVTSSIEDVLKDAIIEVRTEADGYGTSAYSSFIVQQIWVE